MFRKITLRRELWDIPYKEDIPPQQTFYPDQEYNMIFVPVKVDILTQEKWFDRLWNSIREPEKVGPSYYEGNPIPTIKEPVYNVSPFELVRNCLYKKGELKSFDSERIEKIVFWNKEGKKVEEIENKDQSPLLKERNLEKILPSAAEIDMIYNLENLKYDKDTLDYTLQYFIKKYFKEILNINIDAFIGDIKENKVSIAVKIKGEAV